MIAPRQAPAEHRTTTPANGRGGSLRTPVVWGVVWGCLQAASPLAFFWFLRVVSKAVVEPRQDPEPPGRAVAP